MTPPDHRLDHAALERPDPALSPGGAVLLAVGLLACGTGPLLAQASTDDPSGERVWATLGLGRGSEGLAGVAALRFATGPHLVSVRATNVGGITSQRSRADVAVLYGRTKRWPDAYVQASAGLAYVHHDLIGFDERDGVGVPLSAGVEWTPLPVLGLGLHAVGNVNGTEFFGGVTFSVDIGWVP